MKHGGGIIRVNVCNVTLSHPVLFMKKKRPNLDLNCRVISLATKAENHNNFHDHSSFNNNNVVRILKIKYTALPWFDSQQNNNNGFEAKQFINTYKLLRERAQRQDPVTKVTYR